MKQLPRCDTGFHTLLATTEGPPFASQESESSVTPETVAPSGPVAPDQTEPAPAAPEEEKTAPVKLPEIGGDSIHELLRDDEDAAEDGDPEPEPEPEEEPPEPEPKKSNTEEMGLLKQYIDFLN